MSDSSSDLNTQLEAQEYLENDTFCNFTSDLKSTVVVAVAVCRCPA